MDEARLWMRARLVALAGVAAGLAGSSLQSAGDRIPAIATALAAGAILAALWGLRPKEPSRLAAIAWLVALLLVTATAGLRLGIARLEAIDGGAFAGAPAARVEVRGFVAAVPRRRDGEVSVRIETGDGRLLLRAPEPVPDLPVGREVRAAGVVRAPAEWEAAYLARLGVRRVVESDAIRLTGRRRGGIASFADRIRDRAEAALERGTPAAEASLLRGFVLGQDDRIDPATVDDFKRSGLAHLLAVSGQNVLLLALLAAPLLALAGVPLTPRLLVLLGLIALYVPVAGAGPSIQRAGVMGAAGVLAALAGRPASRLYAMLAASAITLALDPRACQDPGWQLSFAAVAGIAVWTPALRRILGAAPEAAGSPTTPRSAVADGAAVTLAATLATGPLLAHHFGAVSIASIPANLAALPAVAPVMWLGMLAAAAGQLPLLPVEPLTGLGGLFAAYIAQIADWFAAPAWASLPAELGSPLSVAGAYGAIALAIAVLDARRRRRSGLRSRIRAGLVAAAVASALVALLAARPLGLAPGGPGPAPGLRVVAMDVGQGDAILLDPNPGDPVLVDGGPPGTDLPARLRDLGVERLAAVVLTHDQLDHAGGITEVLGTISLGRLLIARAGERMLADARSAAVPITRVAEGATIESGELELRVLWPPRELLDGPPPDDSNADSVVASARWRDFDLLLTGDAEAELAPVDPGPVEAIKIAHHGSGDADLPRLLSDAEPQLALISVGDENPYGHPAPETLGALERSGVPVLRTDRDGQITLEVRDGEWTAAASDR